MIQIKGQAFPSEIAALFIVIIVRDSYSENKAGNRLLQLAKAQ
jgi:hypothetical protein